MKNIELITNCCGCYACEIICPNKCIEKIPGEQGFLFPRVNSENCINCGKCINICHETKCSSKKPIVIYGVRHTNQEIVKCSTSGGAFTAISEWILSHNGVVVGAIFDSDFSVVHVCTDARDVRDKMRGAKYVKSDITSVYTQIEQYLIQNRYVLFSGTPCQVTAVNNYISEKRIPSDRFISIDLICHGTSSPKIFKDYLSILQRKSGALASYKFRDKQNGWHGQNVTASFLNGQKRNSGFVKTFSILYFKSYITMERCHRCKHSSMNRIGDITLGDFWGVEKSFPNYADNKGVSLVMLNTQKAIELFDSIKDKMEFWKVDEEQCMQANLLAPCKPNKHKKMFEKIYASFGYSVAYRMTVFWQFTDDIESKFISIIQKFF